MFPRRVDLWSVPRPATWSPRVAHLCLLSACNLFFQKLPCAGKFLFVLVWVRCPLSRSFWRSERPCRALGCLLICPAAQQLLGGGDATWPSTQAPQRTFASGLPCQRHGSSSAGPTFQACARTVLEWWSNPGAIRAWSNSVLGAELTDLWPAAPGPRQVPPGLFWAKFGSCGSRNGRFCALFRPKESGGTK